MPKQERRLKYQDMPADAISRTAARGGVLDTGAYVRVDGTRKMTADWDAGGYEIECDVFDADTAFYYGGVHLLSRVADNNILLGEDTGVSLTAGTADNNIAIGLESLYYNETGDDNICIGYGAGHGASGESPASNVFIGVDAGYAINDGYLNVCLGTSAGVELTTGICNTFLGGDAGGDCKTGNFNTFVGYAAGETGSATDLSGDYNVGVGGACAASLTSGNYNVLVGNSSGSALTTESNNVFLGYNAGALSTSAASVFIGYYAGQNETNDDRLYIANTNTATPLIYGEFDNAEVGINIGASCAGTLHVDQPSGTGAKPVLVLDQADIDVVLMKVIGTAAAASADRTLVADSDFGTPGALAGWIQVEIQDDGNRITDGDFYVPFYAVPT